MIPQDARIARVWRGWTTPDKAGDYQGVVHGEVLPEIFSRNIPGLLGAHLMRAEREIDEEIEFSTIMWFESLDAVKAFVGDDYEASHVPERARAVLKRFDARARHFDLIGFFAARKG